MEKTTMKDWDQTRASWNQAMSWLQDLERLRRAA